MRTLAFLLVAGFVGCLIAAVWTRYEAPRAPSYAWMFQPGRHCGVDGTLLPSQTPCPPGKLVFDTTQSGIIRVSMTGGGGFGPGSKRILCRFKLDHCYLNSPAVP